MAMKTSPFPIRMIASDLDGTFLAPTGLVSEVNRLAVKRAVDEGLHVVFATGRPPSWLSVLEDLELEHSVVVASNGALLYDIATGEVLRQHALPSDEVLDLADQMRAMLPGVTFGVQRQHDFGHEPDYFVKEPVNAFTNQVDADTKARFRQGLVEGQLADLISEGPFVKLLVKHPEASASTMSSLIDRITRGRLTATYSMGDAHGLVEVSAPGVNKATALAEYCAQLGIDPAEVAAFGDMPNDLDMLRWAGHPHLMAHHDPGLADFGFPVIGSNTEDAVGRTILSWLA